MGSFTLKSFDKLFSLPKIFHIDDLHFKNRKSLLDFLVSFKFLTKTSNGFSKTESFLFLESSFNDHNNYNFLSLYISYKILLSLDISKDDPFSDFKAKLKHFSSSISVLIRKILYSSGCLFKKGNQYQLTPLATLMIVRPQFAEPFIQNLSKFLDKEVNTIFLISLTSLKLNPNHVDVSNDFSISFTTKWVQNYFTKLGLKKLFKRIFNDNFKPTEIFFEGGRSTGLRKAHITIFPVLQ